MHKDQAAVQNFLLPLILRKTQEVGSERECTILNRAFNQGPDPLFLMEVCPTEFSVLCSNLGLTDAEGRDAIERAHWQGPGVLLEGTGMMLEGVFFTREQWKDTPLAWKQEALWLCMASVSDTTEEGYSEDVLFATRMQKITACVNSFSRLPQETPWVYAQEVLQAFEKETTFTTDQGIPLTDQDVGFYLAYKKGHKVCAVKHGFKVFYGCVPGVTLDAVGVQVDVKISESYGFCLC